MRVEKVFSIFEPHAELIMRSRRSRPIEFDLPVPLWIRRAAMLSSTEELKHDLVDAATITI